MSLWVCCQFHIDSFSKHDQKRHQAPGKAAVVVMLRPQKGGVSDSILRAVILRTEKLDEVQDTLVY